jgi:hypothetical protein
METIQVELNKTKYTIEEPNIELWTNVMKFKDLLDEEELYIKMISEVLGITREEVLSADTTQILEIGDYVYSFINKESKKLFKQIDFQGTKYNLVDVNNISFGQYVDIDTFLRKEEGYRIANLNELAAYLYTEDGVSYTNSNIKLRIETFKTLPIKYIEGAIFFLLNLAKGSQELTRLYSQSKVMWTIMKIRITLMLIGDGIRQYQLSRTTWFGKLTTWLLYPFISVLITFHILLIKDKNKKD